jgi:hypothetical protein
MVWDFSLVEDHMAISRCLFDQPFTLEMGSRLLDIYSISFFFIFKLI